MTSDDKHIRKVAFIGAGNMGTPMAHRAHAAGFELTVCDRNEAVLEAFSHESVRVTREAADCADADAIVVLLANDAQVMEVMTGPQGLSRHIRADTGPSCA